MKHGARCQIAELVDDAIWEGGIRDMTPPHRMLRGLFGSLFERNVPMDSMSRGEVRIVGVGIVFLLPALLVGFILTLPLELWRSRRVKRHNAEMTKLLAAGGDEDMRGNQDAPEGRLVINYRIERQGRAVFCGVALVALPAEQKRLLGFTVHRGTPPPKALDGEIVRHAAARRGAEAELCHWQWTMRDPYELTERPARPW